LVLALDRPPSFSNVYVWFAVIAAPETIVELDHDAAPSRIQAVLRDGAIWVSLTPLFYTYIYFTACFLLLPLCIRRPLEASLLLSAIGYELEWFFLAASADARYSHWMILCTLIVAVIRFAPRSLAWHRTDSPGSDRPA
jgi:hypothetical protein